MRFGIKVLVSFILGVVIGTVVGFAALGISNAHAAYTAPVRTTTTPTRTTAPVRTTTPTTTKPSVSRTTNTRTRTALNNPKSQNTTYRSFNTQKGYGKTREFPEYRSDGLNFFQYWLLINAINNHSSKGTLIVNDAHGKSHYVDVDKDVYKKWRNRGKELVYKHGHVYQIKTNRRID